ncbi:MAG: DUF805 domain-containing protein [Planctomycetaceae bacterium]|jgi:uncharacterized membrane protein YhaH (DUF805 family)|nr:DUF805 domain-containing protein [Planctomycetaceae bacterium]
MAYYIRIRGKAFGPFDEDQLKEMRVKGKLSRTSDVSENKTDWFPAENLGFLFLSAPSQTTSSGNSAAYSLSLDSGTTTSPPSEPADWFYSINGTEGFGPVTRNSIVQMIQSGTLRDESLVWQQGQNAQQIQTVSLFSGYFSSPANSSSFHQQQTGFQPGNTGLFCSSCGNPVVQTAQICPRCGSSISKNKQNYNSFDENNVSAQIGYFDVLKKYVEFNGRARRKEYWNFTLINMLLNFAYVIFVSIITARIFRTNIDILERGEEPVLVLFLGILVIIYFVFLLLLFLPSLAVMIRRLHDTGNSGWMCLVSLIPVVGGIILFIILVQDSQPGSNRYGINPKYN